MNKTKIDWCDMVWNPVTGCTKISEGCNNCYAERMAKRLQLMAPKKYSQGFAVKCHHESLTEPMKIKKPQRIFVCSMSDLFHEDVPADFIMKVLCVADRSPQHTFIILTKRPARALELFHNWGLVPDDFLGIPPSGEQFPKNVWFGISAENQARADERIPILLQIPTAVRFVSIEPMLEPVDLQNIKQYNSIGQHIASYQVLEAITNAQDSNRPAIDWVICGGETGPNARPMHPDWVRSLRDQCKAASVPFFFKQWGEWRPPMTRERFNTAWGRHPVSGCPISFLIDTNASLSCFHAGGEENAVPILRVGKKKAGHLLDGFEHRAFPEVKP